MSDDRWGFGYLNVGFHSASLEIGWFGRRTDWNWDALFCNLYKLWRSFALLCLAHLLKLVYCGFFSLYFAILYVSFDGLDICQVGLKRLWLCYAFYRPFLWWSSHAERWYSIFRSNLRLSGPIIIGTLVHFIPRFWEIIINLCLTFLKLLNFQLLVSFPIGCKITILIQFSAVLHFWGLFIDTLQLSNDLLASRVVLVQVFFVFFDEFCLKVFFCWFWDCRLDHYKFALTFEISVPILQNRQVDILMLLVVTIPIIFISISLIPFVIHIRCMSFLYYLASFRVLSPSIFLLLVSLIDKDLIV